MRMRIDVQKLDERIKKLQEIRRIAADPELAAILVEFMSAEDLMSAPVSMPKPDDVSTPHMDNTHDFVKDVVSETRDGLWSRKR
jgi:hypothetical protein